MNFQIYFVDGKGFIYVFVLRILSCCHRGLGPEVYIEQQEIAMRGHALKRKKIKNKKINTEEPFKQNCARKRREIKQKQNVPGAMFMTVEIL